MFRTALFIPRVVLLTFLLAPAVHAQSEPAATEEPVPTEAELNHEFDVEQRKSYDEFVNAFQKAVPTPIEQLVRLDVINGNLAASLVPPVASGDRCYVMTNTPPTALRLSVPPPDQFQSALSMFQGHLVRFDAAARNVLTVELYPTSGQTTFTATVETPTQFTNVQLIEHTTALAAMDGRPASATLYVSVNSEIGTSSDDNGTPKLIEPDFATLVTRHHDEALQALGEGLTAVRSMHVLAGLSAKEVAAIFAADRPLDETAQRALQSIIDDVRHGGSESVAANRPKLRALGMPAVMSLARADRTGWSADDAVNIDALAAGLLQFPMDRVNALLSSRARLIDLLYSPDVATRREAAARLERLSHQRIAIDPAVDPYTIAEKIEALRLTLASATTRPAH